VVTDDGDNSDAAQDVEAGHFAVEERRTMDVGQERGGQGSGRDFGGTRDGRQVHGV
jgi:hypothetical protein